MTQIYHSKNIKFYVPLNKKEVLERVSPFSILERYFGNKIELSTTYKSPFREDKNPSFAFHISRVGKCKFIDFATGESGDCFDFIIKLYNCSFKEALQLVNQDFNLGLGREKKVSLERKLEGPPKVRRKPLIQIEQKKYSSSDIEYWNQFGVSKDLLIDFNVFCVNRVWINKKLVGIYKKNNPIFAYFFPGTKHLKIYRPLTKKRSDKWIGNTDRNDIQGLDQLKYKSDSIILTSSLKDVMVLHVLGYEAIALNAEGTRPTTRIIEILDKYEKKFILYDNDEAGINYAKSFIEKVPDMKMLEVLDDKSKDPSDFVAIYGLKKLDAMLKSQYD